ncbi:hypothetical protein K9M79_08030 [Candidatus Woesearchaeota archaeon]|nr:hypothetical protein [Candidatus Woesearchaeota archaeon]
MKKIIIMLAILALTIGCSQTNSEDSQSNAHGATQPDDASTLPDSTQSDGADTQPDSTQTNGASTQPDVTAPDGTNNLDEPSPNGADNSKPTDSQPQVPPEVPAKVIDPLEGSLENCSLLTVEDIQETCGITTIEEDIKPQTGIGQVCSRLFKTDDPLQAIKIVCNGRYNPDDIDTLMEGCGYAITDKSCYNGALGESVTVYGKDWRIVFSNTDFSGDHTVCTSEQLKTLGKIVSDRIYG